MLHHCLDTVIHVQVIHGQEVVHEHGPVRTFGKEVCPGALRHERLPNLFVGHGRPIFSSLHRCSVFVVVSVAVISSLHFDVVE